MKVEYIEPFVDASASVLKMVANIDVSVGKLYLKTSPYTTETLAIIIGVTGDLRGQVVFTLNKESACNVASAMMGNQPVNELDEITKSAISEAGNMILGNAATIFSNKGIKIDITPPTMIIGSGMQFSIGKLRTISVPMNLSIQGKMELDVSLED